MVKLASIDLGSNSTRILIADVNDGKFDVLERMHVVTKMSENIEQSKEISIEAYKRVDSALRIFKKLLVKNDVEDVFVVCLLYTSPSPRDTEVSRMPSSA